MKKSERARYAGENGTAILAETQATDGRHLTLEVRVDQGQMNGVANVCERSER